MIWITWNKRRRLLYPAGQIWDHPLGRPHNFDIFDPLSPLPTKFMYCLSTNLEYLFIPLLSGRPICKAKLSIC